MEIPQKSCVCVCVCVAEAEPIVIFSLPQYTTIIQFLSFLGNQMM